MNVNHRPTAENIGQSVGANPKASKRNSGLFTFLKWFKPFTSRESVDVDARSSTSSSCESITSVQSTGTVASFSFIPPSAYHNQVPEKFVTPTPETDTYKARLKQRDKRRENEKNLTLRKKYNLFFHRDTLKSPVEEDNSRSLPLMTRKMEEEKMHRRTASESSKSKRAGAYCHVKGKRKAPQPPGSRVILDGHSTTSLKRKKRLAPSPPTVEKIATALATAEDVLCNDSLKLDHGILKSVKETEDKENAKAETSQSASAADAPLSPRPWYKRNSSRDSILSTTKKDNGSKSNVKDRLPEVPCARNSTIDLTIEETRLEKKKDEKRKSGMSFLTNISELDREATEIIQKEHKKSGEHLPEMPEFMRPRQDSKINTDSWVSPKRKSARDLIAKFNAITNVTKVTVNSAFFGPKDPGIPHKYFEKQTSLDETKRPQIRKKSDENKFNSPLMKSESASAIKPEHPKAEKENWRCPRCQRENDYWRIICSVCSNIKPYFDDIVTNPVKNSAADPKETQNTEIKHKCIVTAKNNTPPKTPPESPERILERSKTQIGFSALAKYGENQKKPGEPQDALTKKEEKEKLKKMLIEMKNSLPKKRLPSNLKQTSRASIIAENAEPPETSPETTPEKSKSVVIATTETIYENIKMKRTPEPKPPKVSSSAQTSSVATRIFIPGEIPGKHYQLMRPKDFADIYSDKAGKHGGRIYENLARNDDLSLFFNIPRRFSEIKKEFDLTAASNTDTLEINRLLKRLENSIAKGEMVEAALFARELAQLKVNCSVVRQKSVDEATASGHNKNNFTVEMYVEDKISHRGPFPIQVRPDQTVRELKIQVAKEFEIPVAVQRWILGKELASDDNATLADANVTTERCPIFLYLVAPANDVKNTQEAAVAEPTKPETSNEKPKPSVQSTGVKIVEEILKKPDVTPPSTSKPQLVKTEVKIQVPTAKEIAKPSTTKLPTPVKHELKVAPVLEEEPEEYDTKTLKPQTTTSSNEWECTRCTLLNPQTSNVCAVCASVRININKLEMERPKRTKGKAPRPETGEASGVDKERHYLQLLDLDNADVVENTETFECVVCFLDIPPGRGVTLRECLHQFCKLCLKNTIEYSEEAEVKCPYRDTQYSCDSSLQDREIKALVPAVAYDQYLAKSVAQAENKIGKSFHCKTPDCRGWCVYEDNANEFRCPICRRLNCLTCQAIHTGLNCKQYQERMNVESEIDENAKRTKEMLQEMLNKGEALTCPTCQVILMKKWGCDWLRCSMCKTEICWVTRGPRWGPGGKGDTSGGCQCGVNGVKCHPQCNYCH